MSKILDARGNRVDRNSILQRIHERSFLRQAEKCLEATRFAEFGGYSVWLPPAVRRRIDEENPRTIKLDFSLR